MKILKDLRKKKKMSQSELANKLNVTQSMVAKWENGKNMPSVEILIKLSEIFECTIDELVKGKKK